MDGTRILVGVDGSAQSIEALRYAAQLAGALDGPLEAVTTWTFPPVMGAYVIDGWTPDEDARSLLDDAIDEAFDGAPPEGLVRTVLAGPAAGTLIEESRRARMLVLGSRGHGGFAGLLLGSVSAACAAHAHCPVLILHGGDSAASER
ncbi:universal stress protein [Agromyces sp. SYSU T00194]|uniref:universal stress protein n=1 Tax=Agromyces chitinivorans TaxID=3158560 RepID=UPI003396650C